MMQAPPSPLLESVSAALKRFRSGFMMLSGLPLNFPLLLIPSAASVPAFPHSATLAASEVPEGRREC